MPLCLHYLWGASDNGRATLPRMAHPFTFLGYMRPADGYGYAATKIAKALRKLTLQQACVIDMAKDGRVPRLHRLQGSQTVAKYLNTWD